MISQTSEYESLHYVIHHLLLHHFLLVLTFYCSKEIKSMVARSIKNVECYSTRTNICIVISKSPVCMRTCKIVGMGVCWASKNVLLSNHSKSPFMVHILTSFNIPCSYFHKLSPVVNYYSFLEFSMIKDYFSMF